MLRPPSRPLASGSFAVVAVYALAVVVPALLLCAIGSLQVTAPAIAVYTIVVYASLRLAGIAADGQERIVCMTFWVFTYIFLGICPLLQVALRAFPLPGTYDDATLVRAALMVLLGLLAFDAGQRFGSTRFSAMAVPGFLRRSLRKPTIVVAAIAALGLAVFLLQRLGGAEALFLPRVQRAELLADQFGKAEILLLNQLARAPIYAVLLAGLTVWVCARRNALYRAGGGWKSMCLVLLLGTLVINNPVSTPRLTVGTIMLSLLFVLPWKRWYGALCVGGLVAGFIFVFPLADVFRVSLDTNVAEQWSPASAARELAQKMDFDSYQQIANTVALVDREGLQFGRQIAGAVLFWVPRSLWSDKPLSTGEYVGEQTGHAFTNLSAPLWMEFYIDGGLLLVFLGFLGYGLVVRTLDEWNQWSKGHGGARVVSLLVPVYAGYQFFLLRGSLMPAIAYLTPIVIFAVICSLPIPLPSKGWLRGGLTARRPERIC